MRKIKYIVIHHSATSKKLNFEKSLKSFDKNHYERLTKVYLQEKSGTKYENIAYHYVIWGNWEVKLTRNHDTVGFHASNLKINKESIWICLQWNFEEERVNEIQYQKLKKTINLLEKKYWKLQILKHSDIVKKSCPWKNFEIKKIEMWEYEKLFKNGDCMWKSNVISDIEWWIKKVEISRELAFSLLILFERLKK